MKILKLIPALSLIAIAGCASKSQTRVEKDIAQQPESTTTQAAASGRQAIENSNKLTAEQKQKLLALIDQTQAEMVSIRKNEAQAKASLFKYLADGRFENREISTYRKDLKKLEDKKMDLMFSNIAEARKILGKEVALNPELFEFMRYNEERR